MGILFRHFRWQYKRTKLNPWLIFNQSCKKYRVDTKCIMITILQNWMPTKHFDPKKKGASTVCTSKVFICQWHFCGTYEWQRKGHMCWKTDVELKIKVWQWLSQVFSDSSAPRVATSWSMILDVSSVFMKSKYNKINNINYIIILFHA